MIKCLECGKLFVRPLSHVWQVHKLSGRDYKRLHGLDLKKGIATPEYKEKMRAISYSNGTIENLKKGINTRFKKGHNKNYIRSHQTMERLKQHWSKVSNLNGRPIRIEKLQTNCARCGKSIFIYPRAFKKNNNYCGVVCRNITNNLKK